MLRFVLFATLVSTLPEDLSSTLLAIKKLHNKTPYSTFYEIFGASENTSIDSIRKKYQDMMKKPMPISGIKNRAEAVTLLTEAYNILKNKKSTYDFILANSYLYLSNSENFRNNLYIILFSFIVGIIGLDLISFSVRYIRFLSAKLEKPSKGKKIKVQRPSMMIPKGFRLVRSLFKK